MPSIPHSAARQLHATVALILLAAVGPPASAQEPLTVVAFNIRYGTAQDGDHAWPHRRDLVAATLRDHAPHLIGIQEALRFQLDEMARDLPGYREVGVGRSDGQTLGEYAAILVDTARLAVLAEGTFWFSDTPDTPGSMHWGNRITRIATWARLTDRVTGDTLRIYNVHWDHESQPSRERSATLLLDRMATDFSPHDRLLLTGDFNAGEDNPAFQSLLQDARVPLRDTYRARHPSAKVVGTFNAFRGDSTGAKIDAVLVGPGWDVVDADIDRRRRGALWPSDHFLVWGVVRREQGAVSRGRGTGNGEQGTVATHRCASSRAMRRGEACLAPSDSRIVGARPASPGVIPTEPRSEGGIVCVPGLRLGSAGGRSRAGVPRRQPLHAEPGREPGTTPSPAGKIPPPPPGRCAPLGRRSG